MENLLLGYVGALIVGITLGLMGGGGSILTVPIFVYFIGLNPIFATAYSLFVVGTTSLVGAVRQARNQLIDYRTAIVFSIPAFLAVYLTRRFLLPAIPDVIITYEAIVLTKDLVIMVFFAIVMFFAGFSMIRGRREVIQEMAPQKFNYPLIVLEGAVVGVVTGLVGAGGGFLIIPALVIMAKLPMKKAVATSLLIIAVKSLIGFIGDMQNLDIDWYFLSKFTFISIIGIFIGMYFNNFIDGAKLKKGFGWFVLAMAVYIIIMEML